MSLAILVCEPEPNLSQTLHEILTVEGFEVSAVADATEAARLLRSRSWMLAIVSLATPPLQRAELLEAVRGMPAPPNIAFTGDAKSPDASVLARAQGHAILGIPIDPERLKLLAWQAAREAEEREAEIAMAAEVSGVDTQPGLMAAPDLDEVLARAAGALGAAAVDGDDGGPPAKSPPKPPARPAPPTTEPDSDDDRGLGTISSIIDRATADLDGLVDLKNRLTGAFELLRREEQTIKRLVDEKEKLVARTNDIEASLNAQLEQFQNEATQMVSAVQAERDTAMAAQERAESEAARLRDELTQARNDLTLATAEIERVQTASKGADSERASLEAEFGQRQEELKAEAANAWSTLVYAVGSLVTGLPDPSVAINKTGAIIGASRTLAALLGTQANKLIGQPAPKVLSPALQQLLQKAAEPFSEEGVQVEISPEAGSGTFTVIGYPLKSGKAALRVLFLHRPESQGGVGGGDGSSYQRPPGDVTQLIEDFKEKLFSIRLLSDTISTRAESEKIRNVAKDVTGDVDQLVGMVDEMFKAP